MTVDEQDILGAMVQAQLIMDEVYAMIMMNAGLVPDGPVGVGGATMGATIVETETTTYTFDNDETSLGGAWSGTVIKNGWMTQSVEEASSHLIIHAKGNVTVSAASDPITRVDGNFTYTVDLGEGVDVEFEFRLMGSDDGTEVTNNYDISTDGITLTIAYDDGMDSYSTDFEMSGAVVFTFSGEDSDEASVATGTRKGTRRAEFMGMLDDPHVVELYVDISAKRTEEYAVPVSADYLGRPASEPVITFKRNKIVAEVDGASYAFNLQEFCDQYGLAMGLYSFLAETP